MEGRKEGGGRGEGSEERRRVEGRKEGEEEEKGVRREGEWR